MVRQKLGHDSPGPTIGLIKGEHSGCAWLKNGVSLCLAPCHPRGAPEQPSWWPLPPVSSHLHRQQLNYSPKLRARVFPTVGTRERQRQSTGLRVRMPLFQSCFASDLLCDLGHLLPISGSQGIPESLHPQPLPSWPCGGGRASVKEGRTGTATFFPCP